MKKNKLGLVTAWAECGISYIAKNWVHTLNKYYDIINFIKLNANKVDIWFLAAGAYAKPFSRYKKI